MNWLDAARQNRHKSNLLFTTAGSKGKGELSPMPRTFARLLGHPRILGPSLVVLISTLVTLGFVSPATAQQTGTITATVLDQSGVPVQGASVIVLGGAQVGGRSNASGQVTIPKVPVGTYTIRVMLVGYARQERAGIRVDANRATNLGEIKLAEE